jgi:hypothetical protein
MDLGSVNWAASVARSEERCKSPTGRARKLLDELKESNHFWYALRRHGDVETCTKWLEKLRGVSTYDKYSKYEEQRREYLKLVDEINRWQPDSRDRGRERPAGPSNDRAEPYGSRNVSEIGWIQRLWAAANVFQRWWSDEEVQSSDGGAMEELSEPASEPDVIEGLALQPAR